MENKAYTLTTRYAASGIVTKFDFYTRIMEYEELFTLNGRKVRVLGIRRLTPTECARLQTIPEWYNWEGMSDSQRYRVLGNGWTVEVIKHIFSFLPWARKENA